MFLKMPHVLRPRFTPPFQRRVDGQEEQDDEREWNLSSAKTKIVVKRPPSPGDIHDVTRRARNPSQHGNQLATCVYRRWPEHSPGSVPEFQDLMTSEVGLGCNGLPTL